MGSKIPPSKRSPAAHKAANARWYQNHKAEIDQKRREREEAYPIATYVRNHARYLRRKARLTALRELPEPDAATRQDEIDRAAFEDEV